MASLSYFLKKSKKNNNNSNSNSNNGACPPALGPDDPYPSGYIAYARARVAARNDARRAAGLGPTGGACGGGRKPCVCSGMGCDILWNDWIGMGCPDLGNNQAAAAGGAGAGAGGAGPGLMGNGNNENFGLAGSVNSNSNNNNSNSNVSSIHSKNSFNTMAYKQSKQMEKEERNRRRNTRRRRNNRRNNRRRNTRSRR